MPQPDFSTEHCFVQGEHATMRPIHCALILLLAACAGKTPKPNDAPAGLNQDVVLLDQGAEPRAKIRYHGASGRTDRLLLRISLANFIETRVGAAGGRAPLLDLVLHVGASFRGAEEGLWGYPMRFEMIGLTGAEELPAEARDALVAELVPITRTTAVFEIDDRGITRSANVSVPAEASPRLLTMLGNLRTTLLAAALPVEDVGIGARWQAQRMVTVNEMHVPQTVTYTLLGREEDVLRIGIALQQSAAPQEIVLGLDGSRLMVEAYEVNAVGTTLVDLHAFAPMAEVHAVSQMRATVQRGGRSEPIGISGDLTILIAPLPEGVGAAPSAPAPDAAPAAADAGPAPSTGT
jgi:hypothetical protein